MKVFPGEKVESVCCWKCHLDHAKEEKDKAVREAVEKADLRYRASLEGLKTANKTMREAERKAARREAMEECAKIAEAEPELEGEMPEALIHNMASDPVMVLRAAVRSTKRNIAAAIRAKIG